LSVAQLSFREMGNGAQLAILSTSKGKKIQTGDLVSMHMIMKSVSGYEIRNTYKEGKPLLFPSKVPSYFGDLYACVANLAVGDSAVGLLVADSLYQKTFKKEMPSAIKSGSNVHVTFKILDTHTQQAYLQEQQSKKQDFEKSNATLLATKKKEDDGKLKAYFTQKGYTIQKTKSGIYYTILKAGKGKTPVNGSTVLYNYSLFNLKGEKIESTEDNGSHPYSFVVGKQEVIPGWDEISLSLKVGDFAVVGIPSHLAYGHLQKGDKIPPYSCLILELDLLSIP